MCTLCSNATNPKGFGRHWNDHSLLVFLPSFLPCSLFQLSEAPGEKWKMGYSIDLRVNQIRQIIESNDPNTLQYLLPAIKLVKSEYAENTQLEVSESIITLSLDVIKYLIEISGNSLYESRLVTECSIVISQFICCIYDRTDCFAF